MLKLWGLNVGSNLELTMYVRMATCLACKENMNNSVECAYLYNAINLGDTEHLQQTTPRNANWRLIFKVNLTQEQLASKSQTSLL